MREGMYMALSTITVSLLFALEAVAQYAPPPSRQSAQAQPGPRGQAESAQPMPESAQPAPRSGGDYVAMVNGETITRAEFREQVQSTLKVHRERNPEQPQPSPQEVQNIHQRVLDTLIEARLVEQYVREHGPNVEEGEIERVMEGLRQNLASQGIAYEQYLMANKQTDKELRKRIEASLAWQKYQRERMTPDKLREFYEKQRQRFGENTFEQVQPQVTQLYTGKLWNDIVHDMKPKAKIQVAEPRSRPVPMPSPEPVVPRQ